MCKSCCKIHRSQFHDAGKPAGTIALICGIEAEPNCLKNIKKLFGQFSKNSDLGQSKTTNYWIHCDRKNIVQVILGVILDSQAPNRVLVKSDVSCLNPFFTYGCW